MNGSWFGLEVGEFPPLLAHIWYRYSRKTLMGENFHKLVENKIFAEKTSKIVLPKNGTSPNFVEKIFTDSHKTSNFTKVCPSKVSCYTVLVH